MAFLIISREHLSRENDRNWERAAEWLNVWQLIKDLSVPSTEATVCIFFLFQHKIYFWNNNSVIFITFPSYVYLMYQFLIDFMRETVWFMKLSSVYLSKYALITKTGTSYCCTSPPTPHYTIWQDQIPHYSSLTWTMASHVTLNTTNILAVKKTKRLSD